MAKKLNTKETVSFEEHLMNNVYTQEALINLVEKKRLINKELLEEKYLEALDAALPKYEEALQIASEVGIARSEWLDKIRERAKAINPASQALQIVIQERQPRPQMVADAGGIAAPGVGGSQGGSSSAGDAGSEELERNLRRIRNIMDMNIAADEKVKQLGRIEMEAKRNAVLEEERIRELREETGTK